MNDKFRALTLLSSEVTVVPDEFLFSVTQNSCLYSLRITRIAFSQVVHRAPDALARSEQLAGRNSSGRAHFVQGLR